MTACWREARAEQPERWSEGEKGIEESNGDNHRLQPGTAMSVDRGLWTVDCGPWTVDCGLWTVDCRLWTVDCGLWTATPRRPSR